MKIPFGYHVQFQPRTVSDVAIQGMALKDWCTGVVVTEQRKERRVGRMDGWRRGEG